MPNPPTNLRVPKPSRRKPQAGDIFAMRLPDGTYIFGRVMGADLTDFDEAPMPGSYLIYVYRHRTDRPQPDRAELVPNSLLLPPVFINKMPWIKGYFETVGHDDLTSSDHVSQYCFWDAGRGVFVDERHKQLPREVQPCGDWALSSYRWLDDQISDALGMTRVPEDS